MTNLLDNYRQLVIKIDALCQGIEAALGGQIICSAGCSSCCTAITIFPVEAAALQDALDALPVHESEAIRQHVMQHTDGERCPLLSHHRCLLYASRPIICRTHGLPIVYSEEGQHKSDCCPLNLNETGSLPGSSTVDLDKLTTLLVAVNSLFMSQADVIEPLERLTICEAITSRSRKTPLR